MALPLPARPIALTVGSPTFTVPVMYRYRGPPIDFFNGGVEFTRQLDDPEVWPLNSLKRDPVEGEPIRESLHSNFNADMLLECESLSLVGRTDPKRGTAQKIEVLEPLILEDKKLSFDSSTLPVPGNTIITSNKQILEFDHAIEVGSNAISVGPITVATGVVFTVPTGSRWVVV
jgi:hypothetical protein